MDPYSVEKLGLQLKIKEVHRRSASWSVVSFAHTLYGQQGQPVLLVLFLVATSNPREDITDYGPG